MALPVFPTGLVMTLDRRLSASVAATTSPFTLTQQVQDWGGRAWEYMLECKITKGREARELSAFLAALGGSAGAFLFADPTADQPGTPGTPVVSGGGQTGNSLLTAGWPVSAAVMYAGDFFSLGSDASVRLYQLTADVVSTAGGAATLQFVPALRGSPTHTDPLEVWAPKVALRLTTPAPARVMRADKWQFSVSAREAI